VDNENLYLYHSKKESGVIKMKYLCGSENHGKQWDRLR
jgi:hypothetical protein